LQALIQVQTLAFVNLEKRNIEDFLPIPLISGVSTGSEKSITMQNGNHPSSIFFEQSIYSAEKK
jgi:hypothetical protein